MKKPDTKFLKYAHTLASKISLAIQLSLLSLVLFSCISLKDLEQRYPPWSYQGQLGQVSWGALSPNYAQCSEGQLQSPININTMDLDKSDTPFALIQTLNRGLINISVRHLRDLVYLKIFDNATLIRDGKEYSLWQINIHAPSEHQIDGEHYPLELQFEYHYSENEFALVSVLFKLGELFELGDENPYLNTLIPELPETATAKLELDTAMNLSEYIISNPINGELEYYYYEGSLTYPPCSEVAHWYIMTHHPTLSEAQAQELEDILGGKSREIQVLNGRNVYLYTLP